MHQLDKTTAATLQNRPRLALTLGDPAGIGPEVILKALADPQVTQNCDVTVIGSSRTLVETYTQLCSKQQIHDSGYVKPLADPAELSILDVELESEIERQITTGTGNAASGAASFTYLETAIARTLAGTFQGIVTGPIAKSAWKAAGYNYPGQTELLAVALNPVKPGPADTARISHPGGTRRATPLSHHSGADTHNRLSKEGPGFTRYFPTLHVARQRFGMLFVARSPHTGWTLRTLLATTHIPLRQVADTLTPQLLATKLDLLVECLRQDFGLERPSIAIAGLNPHSGELGQLGHEEQEWLIPWLEQERRDRPELHLDGPVPPDTMWVRPSQAWYSSAARSKAHDAYLALYHDQGLIPVKQLAFDRAVNTSIGLPFIRTSPDHGTAFDIAGSGVADATSMKAAIQLATELVNQRVRRAHAYFS